MRKFLISIIIIIVVFVGASAFVSSNYFFNKYIAKNIKEYGFSYTHVDGKLLKGFLIETLKYKGKELSSNVEFKFNPFKLLNGKISINKLHLIGVRKKVLEEVVKDFNSKDKSGNSNLNLDLNFEFNDVILTIKPFILDNINIKKANLAIDYISYDGNGFKVGNLSNEIKSNLVNFNLNGEFKKRELFVKNITIKDLDTNMLISILNSLKNDSNSSSNTQLLSSPLTPKIVHIDNAFIRLKPFNIDDFNVKNLKLRGKNIIFNNKELLLKRGDIKLNYKSKDLVAKIDTSFLNKSVDINSLNIVVNKPNRLEKHIKKLLNASNSKKDNNSSFINYNKLKIKKLTLKAYSYKYKELLLNKLNFKADNFIVDNNGSFTSSMFNLILNSKDSNLYLSGKIDKNILIDSLLIKSNNVDKIKGVILADSNSSHNSNNSFTLPKKIIIKKAKVNLKQITFNPFVLNSLDIDAKNLFISKNMNIDSTLLNAQAVSNFGEAKLSGKIKDNFYYVKGYYLPSQYLLDRYKVPLIAKNIYKMPVDGKIGFKNLTLTTSLRGDNILKTFKDFNILSSKNNLQYDYVSGDISWDMDANIYSPYTKKAKLINKLTYLDKSDKLLYQGKLTPNSNIFNNKKLSKLFSNLQLNYKGGYNSIDVQINSDKLKGSFNSNYSSANILLENKNSLKLSEYIDIGNKFSAAVANKLKITSAINFNKMLPLKGNFDLKGNFANLKGVFNYNKEFTSNFKLNIPRNSLLLKDSKKIIYSSIKDFDSKLTFNNNTLNLILKNHLINGALNYNINSNKIDSTIKSGALKLDLKGLSNSINLKIASSSINSTLSSIKKIYKLDSNIKLDGKAIIKAKITNGEIINFNLNSPSITYKSGSSNTLINNIKVDGKYSKNSILINNYSFITNGYKIYSTKTANIDIVNNNLLKLNYLWINDSLKLSGNYNLNRSSGSFKVNASSFKLENKDAKINLSVNGNLQLDKKRKFFKGNIKVLSGLIKSTITRKNLADNSDIIILQRKRAKESTNFAKNVKLNLKLSSNKPILYVGDGGYFKLNPNITIVKNYNSLSKFNGKIYLKKGSYYKLNKKKLNLIKGTIVFSGKSSSPNLNIELGYRGKDYNIKINVSGTPTRPILFFSSNPTLTKEQILAYLLFDDTSAVGTHSQSAMLNIIGGSLAKSLLGSIGIKIDHISVRENGFSIGKSINKNVTVYYNQDKDKASVKTRIDITKHIKTVIDLGKEKQSADIIFSKEY